MGREDYLESPFLRVGSLGKDLGPLPLRYLLEPSVPQRIRLPSAGLLVVLEELVALEKVVEAVEPRGSWTLFFQVLGFVFEILGFFLGSKK